MTKSIENKRLYDVEKEFNIDSEIIYNFFLRRGYKMQCDEFRPFPYYNATLTADMYNLWVEQYQNDKIVQKDCLPLEQRETVYLEQISKKHNVGIRIIRLGFEIYLGVFLKKNLDIEISQEMYQRWLKEVLPNMPAQEQEQFSSVSTPNDYGYRSWADMELGEVWEGDLDAFNAHNE